MNLVAIGLNSYGQTKTHVQSINCTQTHCEAYVTLTMLLRVLCTLIEDHYLLNAGRDMS